MTKPIAVVTGASRGIGSAIAERLLVDGYQVFNLDRQAPDSDNGITFVQGDLSEEEQTRAAFEQILNEGPIAALVNNAGIPGDMDLLEGQTVADMDRVYAINMRAPVLCAQRVIPGMREAGFGRIINIASRAHLGKAQRTAYGGSKGGLVSMTRVWAIELADSGITCNAVAPGPVRTELFEKANPPDMPRTQQIIDGIPVKRIGEPDDIAHAVSYFADQRSGFVTGQVLCVCGGTMLTRGGS